LPEILGGDLAGQTRTERGSIRERLRPGDNVHAVGFGCIEHHRGRHTEASSEDHPARTLHAVDDTRILNCIGRVEQKNGLRPCEILAPIGRRSSYGKLAPAPLNFR
jgi:hypothetical protein